MSEHLSENQIANYRQLLPGELLALDDHLAECESCRKKLILAHETPYTLSYVKNDLLTSLPIHLSYDHLESYVDGVADETDCEIVESHISICERCNEQLQDLRAVASQITSQKASSWKDKVSFLWRSPDYSAPFRALAYAAIVATFALILSILLRPESNLKSQLKEATDRNKQLEKQIAQLQKTSQPAIAWNDIQAYPDSYQQIAKSAFAEEQVAVPTFVQELRGNQKILMGNQDAKSFRVLNPVGVVVESTNPEFHWTAIPGAKYVVRIYDAQYNSVVSSPALSESNWKLAEPLQRDKIYVWNVTATVGNQETRAPVPPSPEAKFQIMEESKLKDLNSIRTQYPQSHLLLGLAYSKFGLMDEAVKEFEELKKQNPDSILVNKLLTSLQ